MQLKIIIGIVGLAALTVVGSFYLPHSGNSAVVAELKREDQERVGEQQHEDQERAKARLRAEHDDAITRQWLTAPLRIVGKP